MSDSNEGYKSYIRCGCWLMVLIFNFFVGGWSVNYLLAEFATKTIPLFWSGVVGLFAGEISVPVAVVVFILKKFGIL